jgi:hypothetical protein
MRTACDVAEELLGPAGRMITLSKSRYRERFPDHVVIFNANICVRGSKIWHGDLDLTVDESKVVDLADRLGKTVFVLYEGDGRFANEATPLLDRAAYRAVPGRKGGFS